jgi:hypothetical protein
MESCTNSDNTPGEQEKSRTIDQYFSFNDNKIDVQAIKNYINDPSTGIGKVTVAGPELVHYMIACSGVYDKNEESIPEKKKFLEEQATGKMDYGAVGLSKSLLDKQSFYIINTIGTAGTAYNVGDMGNFIWGAAINAIGLGKNSARLGAHYNQFFNVWRKSKKGELPKQWQPGYDFGPGTYNVTKKIDMFDSKADQKAIFNGWMFHQNQRASGAIYLLDTNNTYLDYIKRFGLDGTTKPEFDRDDTEP